tara:strand:+ start:11661 stop:12080 length:420 start_codon:yes stop_codon:yes gene_type:complete
MIPIPTLKLPPYIMYRYAIPKSMKPIASATAKRLANALRIAHSNVLQLDDKLFVLYQKSESLKTDCLMEIQWAALLQEKAEGIARNLNNGRFCHCYLNKELLSKEWRSINVIGKSVFIALEENKKAKNVCYDFNYLINK